MIRFARTICLLAALLVVANLGLTACGSAADERAAISGQRIAPAGIATPLVSEGGEAAGPTVTPWPTNPADEGVIFTAPTTPTPDPAPANAAPAVAGEPIVVGLSPVGLQAPEAVRPGVQKYGVVNVSGASATLAIIDGSIAEADLAVDGDGIIYQSELLDTGRSVNFELELAAGGEVVCGFRCGGRGCCRTCFHRCWLGNR